jgi:hypothetical protein
MIARVSANRNLALGQGEQSALKWARDADQPRIHMWLSSLFTTLCANPGRINAH